MFEVSELHFCIYFCVLYFISSFYEVLCREDSERSEREKCLDAEKMKENKSPEILKLEGFFFFFFNDGKCWVEFGYIVFGLNGAQWVFS